MIQSIVEQKAFQRGHEYFKENRVRLLEADDTDIAATVRGNSGVYEQTIRLREGNLVTACSCSLIEQPMCRHCVAVLLEYHRWSSQRGHRDVRDPLDRRNGRESRSTPPTSNGKSSSAPDQEVKLSEIIAFVEWAQPAMRALAQNESVPETPRLPSGMAADWAQTIVALDRRCREQADEQQALHADLAQRDLQLQQLRQQLKTGQDELTGVRQTCQRLEEEMAAYQAVIGKLREFADSFGQYETDMNTVAGDLSKSQGRLEHLASSFRDVSSALQDVVKSRPS